MLKKFLKEVVVTVVGKQAEEIIDLLDAQKYINEFIIAKKLGITINQTRNILYKISDQGLVSSTRKKDKKKGWYTYFWKLETLKCLEFLREIFLKKKEQIANQIKSRESKEFYVCERCDIEFTAENALLHDFTCNECGDIFALKDNSKLINELKKNLDKLNREMALIEEEIRKEKEKLDKEKVKGLKKEEKIKEKIKEAKRLERNKLKKMSLKIKNPPKTKLKSVKRKPVKKILNKIKQSKKRKR